jgi:hypothetical protein
MPRLKGTWRYDATARQIAIELAQVQGGPAFRLPLEIGVAMGDGRLRIERVELSANAAQFTLRADAEPRSVVLDPDTWLLLDAPEFTKSQ